MYWNGFIKTDPNRVNDWTDTRVVLKFNHPVNLIYHPFGLNRHKSCIEIYHHLYILHQLHHIEPTQELYWNLGLKTVNNSFSNIEPTQELYWNFSKILNHPILLSLNRHKSCIEILVAQIFIMQMHKIEPTQELYWNSLVILFSYCPYHWTDTRVVLKSLSSPSPKLTILHWTDTRVVLKYVKYGFFKRWQSDWTDTRVVLKSFFNVV